MSVRNSPCQCGSGKKFKYCCLLKQKAKEKAIRDYQQAIEVAKLAAKYQRPKRETKLKAEL